MSDYKFVDYKPTDGDSHTSRMLEEEHHGNVPTTVTDEQLRDGHASTEDSSIEKLLEGKRLGSAEVIIEKNLNDSKDQFGSKHRNASAYEGDISKLEEQRIEKHDTEDEKYESASTTPKEKRWWEVKTEDGLKIAFKKESAADFDDLLRSLDRGEYDDYQGDDQDANHGDHEDFDLDQIESDHDMGPTDGDTGDFGIDDLDSGPDDFGIDDIGNAEGIDALNDPIKEISFKKIDVGGTPMATGVLEIEGGGGIVESPSDIEQELRDFMETNHPELPVSNPDTFSLDSFDFSKIQQGIVTYNVALGSPDSGFNVDDVTASTSFPIIVTSKKK